MDQHAKAGRQGRLTRIKLSDQIAEDLRRRIARSRSMALCRKMITDQVKALLFAGS